MYRYRFLYLLAALVLVLLVGPIVQTFGSGAEAGALRIVVPMVLSAMLLTAVNAVSQHRAALIIAGALAVLTIVLQVLTLTLESDGIAIAYHLLFLAFLGYAIALLLKFLFAGYRITMNTIYASLCVFLLLGVAWGLTYSLIEILVPGSFVLNSPEAVDTEFMRFGPQRSVYPLYYSYVTLTTLGYGDIIPVSPLARMTAVLEAITGQLYIAVLVARLVGLHIYHSTAARTGTEV